MDIEKDDYVDLKEWWLTYCPTNRFSLINQNGNNFLEIEEKLISKMSTIDLID